MSRLQHFALFVMLTPAFSDLGAGEKPVVKSTITYKEPKTSGGKSSVVFDIDRVIKKGSDRVCVDNTIIVVKCEHMRLEGLYKAAEEESKRMRVHVPSSCGHDQDAAADHEKGKTPRPPRTPLTTLLPPEAEGLKEALEIAHQACAAQPVQTNEQ